MDLTVAVATYGDTAWVDLAHDRAIPSVPEDVCLVHVHGETLHGARNQALAQVDTEHVCFLDADDELEDGFFDAIATSDADLRVPAVRYVRGGRPRQAAMPRVAGHTHECTSDCLTEGNWLVVGTVAPAQLLRQVGGWRDFAWSEDWDLWLRCHLAGATIEAVPEAVYRAHVRPDSRNRAPDLAFKEAVHAQIYEANFGRQMEKAA